MFSGCWELATYAGCVRGIEKNGRRREPDRGSRADSPRMYGGVSVGTAWRGVEWGREVLNRYKRVREREEMSRESVYANERAAGEKERVNRNEREPVREEASISARERWNREDSV